MKNQKQVPTQLSFAGCEFVREKHVTRREKFLANMEPVGLSARPGTLTELAYPTSGPEHLGRQPIGIACMLRVYLLQQWFGLANEAVENAIDGSQSMREFVDIDLACESVPNATILLRFKRPLEEHSLAAQLFGDTKARLSERGRCRAKAR